MEYSRAGVTDGTYFFTPVTFQAIALGSSIQKIAQRASDSLGYFE
jgi:hypothetical protein